MTNHQGDDRFAAQEAALAAVLKAEATVKGVSAAELAERIDGMSESTVRRMLKGEAPLVVGNAMRISAVLGMDFITAYEMAADRVRRGL